MKQKTRQKIRFDVITIFPNILDSYFQESLFEHAQEKKIVDVRFHDLRSYVEQEKIKREEGKRRNVDDSPYGGGPGMVLRVEPIYKAIKAIEKKGKKKRIIVLSTRGKKLDSKKAKELSKYNQLILICGRYEGIDERVIEHIADEEISIGDYILAGGELAAAILIEATSRFIPGFLGKQESLEEIHGSFPTYTRPPIFYPSQKTKGKNWKVPEILLSGNHEKISEWRKKFKKA
jgi:tRNA (guanine37-N1)-methyltransferase